VSGFKIIKPQIAIIGVGSLLLQFTPVCLVENERHGGAKLSLTIGLNNNILQ
jgi:hypothetical protein